MTSSNFPSDLAISYTGNTSTPEVEEENDSDRPAPPDESDSDDESTDTSDDETTDTSEDDSTTTSTYNNVLETDEEDSTDSEDVTDEEDNTDSEEVSDEEDSTDSNISNTVEVTGLLPGTEYVYRVGDGANFSKTYSFTTADTDQDGFAFIVVGDPQIGSSGSNSDDQSGWQTTLTQAVTNFPESSFILGVGDQINTSSDEDEYSAFFAPDELASHPFIPAIGNHDNNTLFQYHFTLPNESSDYGTTDAGGDYSFTYGNTVFMVLNTNNASITSHQSFIEETLADTNDTIEWKMVVLHHSIYSSASHSVDTDILTLRSGLYPVFDDNDIDVVFMGHDHVYSRSYQMYGDEAQTEQVSDDEGNVVDPTGTLYLTFNSSSNSKYYDLEDYDSAYRAFRWQGYESSYSHVEIVDKQFSITTYTSSDNEVIDTYSILKTD